MRKFFNTLWLLVILLEIFCSSTRKEVPSAPSTPSAISFYYAALSEIEKGNFEAAIAKLNIAIQHNPGYVQFYFVKGRVFELWQKPDSAIKAYETCLKYKTHYPEVWLQLGHLFLQKEDFGSAALHLRKAANEFPDSLSLNLYLGRAYYSLKKYSLALDFLERYQRRASRPDLALFKWLGLTHYQLNQYPEARENLSLYLEQRPEDFEAHKYLGFTQFQLGQYNAAMSSLSRALHYRKNDPEIYLYRARYFRLMNKPATAKEQLFMGLRLDSTNVDILCELGILYFEEKDVKKSKEYLLRTIQKNPRYWRSYRFLGFIAEEEKDWKSALTYYNLYLENILVQDAEVRERLNSVRTQIIKNK